VSNVIPAWEMMMTTWEILGKNHPELARFMDIGLEWAVKYYERMDLSKAYIVAMRKRMNSSSTVSTNVVY